jgi:peptide/nickel transport system permease protein
MSVKDEPVRLLAGSESPESEIVQKRISRWRSVLNRRPSIAFAGLVLVTIITVALLAPVISPFDPAKQSLPARLKPPVTSVQGELHVLGTDQLGRDILSRLIYGSRISLVVGFTSVVIAGMLGVGIGLLAGYFGGRLDIALMRIADVLMAFPFILLALAVIAVLGASVRNVIIVFGITSWVVYARTTRALVLTLRDSDFVVASQALGAGHGRLLVRHVLPNLLSPIIVIASFEVARIITTEASLTFLGLGIPPTTPSWGAMISDGRQYLQDAWWIATFPGLLLLLLVVAISFLGDELRDVLDPRSDH